MSTTPTLDPVDVVVLGFQKVMIEFKDKLKDEVVHADILKTTSIDQVYDLAESIQKGQEKTGHLRHLSKIQKYLEKLRLYADTIDTFVQVKPDILALIWGPMKLLIQWASTLKKSQDAIVNITAEIGDLLPEFKEMTLLFDKNSRLNAVMVLFFQDILDFHLVALKFFALTRWKYFFEALWPKHQAKSELVKRHVERQATMMRTEVRWEHIREENDTRQRALEHFEKSEQENMHQEFHRIRTSICPKTYDEKLDWINGRLCEGTGKWLLRSGVFKKWLEPTNFTTKMLWLKGIPGAGKRFLAATAIQKCQSMGKPIFAFLSHNHASNTSALSTYTFS